MRHRSISTAFLFIFLSSVIPRDSICGEELKGTRGKDHPVGISNRATSNVIKGYKENAAAANVEGAAIGGGGRLAFPNRVVGNFGAVGGGEGNVAGDRATVSGGSLNEARGFRSGVGGGSNNIAQGEHSTVSGGTNNTASATRSTVSGGCSNTASHLDTTIGGGSGNIASFTHATVAGGTQNTSSSLDATVGGGSHNMASGAYTTISGGSNNLASGFSATVGGGSGNAARAGSATIGGGLGNRISDHYSTVGGGLGNTAGNGNEDLADAQYSTVGGGIDNTASGLGSTVSGGEKNLAGGSFSTIPGGFRNKADGHYTFAAGYRANIDASHPGTFLYADSNDNNFDSKAPNEFAVRATGGVRFVTGIDPLGSPHGGVKLEPGSSSWSSLSSWNTKANFSLVEGKMVLRRLNNVPIGTWNYKDQAPSIRHMGPQAEGFYAAFNLGEDERYISTIDANGVALAAIQGLHQMVKEQEDQMIAQQRKIAILELEKAIQQERIVALEGRLARIEEVFRIK
jgi:trimeric autotransporter adhesin